MMHPSDPPDAAQGREFSPQFKAGMRFFIGFHAWVYRLTGGRLMNRIGSAPVLLLTTIGRSTGQARTTPLVFLADGDRCVVVGSGGASRRDPAWVRNLRANPDVLVQVGSRVQQMRAVDADAAERARLWPALVALFPRFGEYQQQVSRPLPIVVLHPHTAYDIQ
jgi:F420H(2)-dependent quinone reductase